MLVNVIARWVEPALLRVSDESVATLSVLVEHGGASAAVVGGEAVLTGALVAGAAVIGLELPPLGPA
jgi:hypothetical protein